MKLQINPDTRKELESLLEEHAQPGTKLAQLRDQLDSRAKENRQLTAEELDAVIGAAAIRATGLESGNPTSAATWLAAILKRAVPKLEAMRATQLARERDDR